MVDKGGDKGDEEGDKVGVEVVEDGGLVDEEGAIVGNGTELSGGAFIGVTGAWAFSTVTGGAWLELRMKATR